MLQFPLLLLSALQQPIDLPQVAVHPDPAQMHLPAMPSGQAGLQRADRATQLARQFLATQGVVGDVVIDRDLGWSTTAERVTFRRTVNGIPVWDEVVKVVMFRDGSVIVEGNPGTHSGSLPSSGLTEVQAREAALANLSEEFEQVEVLSAELIWYQNQLAWSMRTHVTQAADAAANAHSHDGHADNHQHNCSSKHNCEQKHSGDWHVDLLLNAETGTELLQKDLRIMCWSMLATGSGDVFIPNPVQTSGDHGMKDQNDSNSAVPGSEYFTVDLLDLAGTGYLDGPYCSTAPTSNRVRQTNFQFHFQRNANAFEEVMTYYHIDSYQRYLQSVGQMNANNRQQDVDVNGYSGDNSWYDLGSREITLGSGGVDDAEDADIIIHEYGHALHHDVQGGIGSGENGAMSEGYGDYFAASFYDDALVGEWDAVSYTGGSLHYLRRVDEQLFYPNDKIGQVHYDGQIWSAALWDLRSAVGRAVADNIIVEAMSLQSNSTNMPSAGNWLLTAEQQLYGGAWKPYVEWALHRRGIKTLGSSIAVLSPVDATPTPGQSTTFNLKTAQNNLSYKTLASLQPGENVLGPPHNVTIHVGLDLLQQSLGTPGMSGNLNGSGDATFSVTIPSMMVAAPVVFQSAVFNGAGDIVEVSKPCAVRMGPH